MPAPRPVPRPAAPAPAAAPPVACHAVDLAGEVPEWVELIPAGAFTGRDGRGPYHADLESVAQAFAAWGMPLAIDYEHQAHRAADNGQPAPAAGWVTALEVRDGAVWGRVDWTERAAAHIGQREYRYLSPVFQHDAQGTVRRLLGAGLTNNPNLYLTALNQANLVASVPSTRLGGPMEDMTERLRYLLNLPVTVTPEEIVTHLQRLIDALAAPATAAMRSALALPESAALPELLVAAQGRIANPPAPDPQSYVLATVHHGVCEELAALKAERHAARVDRAVGEALAAGKIVPAQEVWARAYCTADVEGFAAFAAAAPVQVPLGEVATHARAGGANEVPGYQPPAGYRVDPEAAALHQRALVYQAEHQTDYLTAVSAVSATAQ